MKICELHKKYLEGELKKDDYAVQIFSKYIALLDYRELLSESDACEIVINSNDVYFDILEEDSKNQKYHVLMKLWEKDIAQVPATITTFGSYEKIEFEVVKLLLNYLSEGSVIFDVGANLGWYSLNIKKQRPDLNVYAFEPIAETYKKLKYHLNINNVDIHTFNYGFYKESGEVDFFYDTVASGASSMRDLRELDTTIYEKCYMDKMDDFCDKNDISRLDFIKCDVEGSELFVYQGGIECLRRYNPIVFSEMLRKWSAKFEYHPNDIIGLFKDIGYNCYVISKNNRLKKIDVVTENTVETNYIFLNACKHKTIIDDMVE